MKRLVTMSAIVALLSASAFAASPESEGSAAKPHGHHWKQHAAERWAKVRADLKLNPAQDFAWQQIADKRAALHKEHRADRTELREAMKQELAKPEPDFGRIAQQKQQLEEKSLQARNELRDLQLKLYASFNPEQKAVIRDVLKVQLERMEQWRQKRHGTS
jgi:Spy/CpxP family protein refolding chaperone